MQTIECRGRETLYDPRLIDPPAYPLTDAQGRLVPQPDAPAWPSSAPQPRLTMLSDHGYAVDRQSMQHWLPLSSLYKPLLATSHQIRHGWQPEIRACVDATRSETLIYLPRERGYQWFGPPRLARLHPGDRDVVYPPYRFKPFLPAQQVVVDHVVRQIDAQLATRGFAGALLVLWCGFGKSLIFFWLAVHYGRKTLIVLDQDSNESQQIANGKKLYPGLRIGRLRSTDGADIWDRYDILVGKVQSLCKRPFADGFFDRVGTIIYDEVHTVPSPKYSQVFFQINTPIMIGVTATLPRPDALHSLLEDWLGAPLVYIPRRESSQVTVRVVRLPKLRPALRAQLNAIGVHNFFKYRETLELDPNRIDAILDILRNLSRGCTPTTPAGAARDEELEDEDGSVAPNGGVANLFQRMMRKRPMVEKIDDPSDDDQSVLLEEDEVTSDAGSDAERDEADNDPWIYGQRVHGICVRCQGYSIHDTGNLRKQERQAWCLTMLGCNHMLCEACVKQPESRRVAWKSPCECANGAGRWVCADRPVIYEGTNQACLLATSCRLLDLIQQRVEAEPWAPTCGRLYGGATSAHERSHNELALRKQWVFGTYQKANKALDLENCRYMIFLSSQKAENVTTQATGRNQRKIRETDKPEVWDLVDDDFVARKQLRDRIQVYESHKYRIVHC